ncbi:hypothetical protein AVEN_201579-1 [Araneus ventricosus]|uniref:Uncharacterized protein n=1 Tax=Araneus ventricosus TaxID=182803 RepID=A0A4Y2FGU0_ARAVE|nr:hypothetical protein AVEN_201579-1 [Araneus ventricosus]
MRSGTLLQLPDAEERKGKPSESMARLTHKNAADTRSSVSSFYISELILDLDWCNYLQRKRMSERKYGLHSSSNFAYIDYLHVVSIENSTSRF